MQTILFPIQYGRKRDSKRVAAADYFTWIILLTSQYKRIQYTYNNNRGRKRSGWCLVSRYIYIFNLKLASSSFHRNKYHTTAAAARRTRWDTITSTECCVACLKKRVQTSFIIAHTAQQHSLRKRCTTSENSEVI